MSEREAMEQLAITTTALKILVAALAKDAKARDPDFERRVEELITSPVIVDVRFAEGPKEAIRRLLSV